jgi:addiction module HigA family antidote
MASKRPKLVHPGEILRRDFMRPLGLSSYGLARMLGVSIPTVNEIVRGRRAVTAPMALRFSRYFGTTAHYWQNLQAAYDLVLARRKIGAEVKMIKRAPRRNRFKRLRSL